MYLASQYQYPCVLMLVRTTLLQCRPIEYRSSMLTVRASRPQSTSAVAVRCVEVGGAWGSAAKTFFNTCVVLAGDDRDIDLYHWSSERFSAAWRTTISVLVAKGRARVGVAGAATDWPKRIRDLQFLDHEGDPTTI